MMDQGTAAMEAFTAIAFAVDVDAADTANAIALPLTNHPDAFPQSYYSESELVVLRNNVPAVSSFTAQEELVRVRRMKLSQDEWESVRVNQAYIHGRSEDQLWLVSEFLTSHSVIDHWTVLMNTKLGPSATILLANLCPANALLHLTELQWRESAHQWHKRFNPKLTYFLMPVHINDHFVLLVVDLHAHAVELWDSLPSYIDWCSAIDRVSFGSFLSVMVGQQHEWTFRPAAVPRQSGSNCGVYVIEFMRAFVEGHRPTACLSHIVSERKMPASRARIMAELEQLHVL